MIGHLILNDNVGPHRANAGWQGRVPQNVVFFFSAGIPEHVLR